MPKLSRARLTALALIPCAALAVFALARSARGVPEPTASSSFTPTTTSVPEPTAHVDPAQIAAVADEVERQNRESKKDRDAFQNAGWTLTQTAPPDQGVVNLDPAMLADHEPELRAQIASTTAPPDQAPRVLAIAERARDVATRVVAAEALGRMGTPGQEALMKLLAGSALDAGDPARASATSSIRPPIGDAALTNDLEDLTRSPRLSPTERAQLQATLAIAKNAHGVTR